MNDAFIHLFLDEPVSVWKALLIMVLILGGFFVVVAFVGYHLAKALSARVSSQRDDWQSSVGTLGLEPEPGDGGIHKAFSGENHGRSVRVEYFAIPTGRYSADRYAAIEVGLNRQIPFSFELKKGEMFYQKVAAMFDASPETGHALLDKAFQISASDIPGLMEMLNVEMLDGQSPTLLNDLLLAAKRYKRVRVSDRSVTLSAPAESGPGPTREALEKACYIASRIEKAFSIADSSRAS